MGNYRKVFTRRPMTAEKVQGVLDGLNETRFKGLLETNLSHDTWGVSMTGWFSRCCWLETRRTFIMDHGGAGGHFAWWVDCSICNAVAVQFGGRIWDEGGGPSEQGRADYYPDYRSFAEMLVGLHKEDLVRRMVLQTQMDLTPPEFRFDAGRPVLMEGSLQSGFTLRES